MSTPRDLKVQMAAETRARERAQALAKAETIRADRAEANLREALADRDVWKRRAMIAQAAGEGSSPDRPHDPIL